MNIVKRGGRNLQRREAREHLGLSTADDPPQHYSTLLTTPPLSGSPFSFVFHLFLPGVSGGRGFWVGSLGVWSVFAPPPLVTMGRVLSMPGAPQGSLCFGCGVSLFSCFFLFTPHPPAGPFPTPGPCVFTRLSGCFFLSHFLSLSGSLSGHCLYCSCLLCQIRDTFQVPKALSIHSVLCWFFLFFLLSFVSSFFFCFFHQHSAAVKPPPIQRWGLGIFWPAGSEKDIQGGDLGFPG